jgi:hypothetical protein
VGGHSPLTKGNSKMNLQEWSHKNLAKRESKADDFLVEVVGM